MTNLTMLLSGDFRQTSPVLPRGSKTDEMLKELKPLVTHHTDTLSKEHEGANRLQHKSTGVLLLKIGDSTYPEEEGRIVLSNNLGHTVNSVKELIASVYGDQR